MTISRGRITGYLTPVMYAGAPAQFADGQLGEAYIHGMNGIAEVCAS